MLGYVWGGWFTLEKLGVRGYNGRLGTIHDGKNIERSEVFFGGEGGLDARYGRRL